LCFRTFAGVQHSLLEVFSAVSEGRLSPVDAAQTVEEVICAVPMPEGDGLPRILNGHGKRAEAIGRQMQQLQNDQGHVLVTGIDPGDYAEIRKIVHGVQYHAGAKTLKTQETAERLPGSVGIISDTSVPSSAPEELSVIAEYLGCYTFQIDPLSVTHLTHLMQQMKSASAASVILVVYDEETALPDVVAGLTDSPVISIRVGDRVASDLPSGTMTANSLVTAAYSAAKILKSVERIRSLQHPISPFTDAGTVDEQIHDALEILSEETKSDRRVNNVVSSEVRDALPSDSVP